MLRPSSSWILFSLCFVIYAYYKRSRKQRQGVITPGNERVLVLGGSSGIGREIAIEYAARRGARVCVVGRRKDKVDLVVEECRSRRALGISGDFSNVKDILDVRETLEKEWSGVDTVIVAAGVSALRPLLDVAGVPRTSEADASEEGIQNTLNAAHAALQGNYIGPMVAALSLIPMLQRTSRSPSILLVSSLGAVIPAPTRAMYGSTKSASLILYQALAIEHPAIRFSFVLPSTVKGDFRASAVDLNVSLDHGQPRLDHLAEHNTGLEGSYVAKRCIDAVDEGKRVMFLPEIMGIGHLLYWLWPGFIEKQAMKKYGFIPE